MTPLVIILSFILVAGLASGIGAAIWLKQRNMRLAMTHYDQGVSYLHAGKYPRASNEFQHALKYHSSLIEARYGLGLTYLKQQHYQEGIAMLEAAVKEMPRNTTAFFNLGQAYIKVGNLAQARRALETAARLDPQMKEVQFSLARVFEAQGDLKQAQRHCQRALDLDANYTKAKEYFAILTRDVSHTNPALIRRALADFDPHDTEFMLRI
jgi:tetratricopeptide (TPR) repeat protein